MNDLLRHYEEELTHLQKMGKQFAEKYPGVASSLGMEGGRDPYVERLIESFAYLTARIRHNLDNEFVQIPEALLGILYPSYINPIPSMAIAQFEAAANLTSGYTIPRHTPLIAKLPGDEAVKFRTCYPMTVWPVAVEYAGFEASEKFAKLRTSHLPIGTNIMSVLRIRIKSSRESLRLRELNLDRLRFFLNGESTLIHPLYEMFFSQLIDVVILPDGEQEPIYLSGTAIKPVGFDLDDEVIPCPSYTHSQYRLLQEYFLFPEKYLFVDVDGLKENYSEKSFDLLFRFDRMPRNPLAVDQSVIRLGCTPIINLFPKTTDPIRWDHIQSEYDLVPDSRRQRSTEIHSILSVSGTFNVSDRSSEIEPYFSFKHQSVRPDRCAFWIARRVPSEKSDMSGTNIRLSIVDLDFHPSDPAMETIYAHTLCTNRDTASKLPVDARLTSDGAVSVAQIKCLTQPTPQIDPMLAGKAYWRLISHLALNHVPFSLDASRETTSSQESDALKKIRLDALKEMLLLYAFGDDAALEQQIRGIESMEIDRIVGRVGDQSWRGFCQGTRVTLTFDETMYVGSSAFLLGAVLSRFFALSASINSFVQLVVRSKQRKEDWKVWKPVVGEQEVL